MYDQILSTHKIHTASVVFKEKVNSVSHLCVSHFKVNNLDAVLEQLSDISDTYLKHAENLVLEAIKLPIIKLTQTQG